MRIKQSILLSCVLMAAAGAAVAQAPPAPATPPAQTAPPSPARGAVAQAPPAPATPPAHTAPPAGVDPEMHAPAPDVGNTPVIPPPGSPGGDPTIRPK